MMWLLFIIVNFSNAYVFLILDLLIANRTFLIIAKMMELNLSRVDYTQVGITAFQCMKLVPSGSKKDSKAKIAVGDKNGVLQLIAINNSNPTVIFKTAPGPAIEKIRLGGPPDGIKDKIFITAGTQIRGYNKKGGQFMQFETNMTEPVKSLYVEGSDLFVIGSHNYQHYRDLKDMNNYFCSDKINDIICLPINKVEVVTPVLACQDRLLRVLKGSNVHYEIEVSGPPNILSLHMKNGGEEGNEVLYGTTDGKIGLVQIGPSSPTYRWEFLSEKSQGGVTALDNYDITKNGSMDLLVGRDDGTVEVYAYDEVDEPILRYHVHCNECITALYGGIVSNTSYDEIICTTYAGLILSLTTEPQEPAISSNNTIAGGKGEMVAANLATLKSEISNLQNKVAEERARYQTIIETPNTLSAVPMFDIMDKFSLQPSEACYSLSIECQGPIDTILLQSNVPLDLMDVEKNSAVVSFSQCNPDDGNYLLATYRCQSNTTRLEVKVRSIEGQFGKLQVYVTPRTHPKMCQVKSYDIKPLSLHRNTHQFQPDRPLNTLKLSGAFSLGEMHSWIVFCIPDVPERVPAEEIVSLTFESTFLGTHLEIIYKKGEATFRSDNLSTISILKDILSKEATKKKVSLSITYDICEESIAYTLHLIDPKMNDLLLLAKKVQLIEPLRELAMCEQDSSVMSPEYQLILKQADQLQLDFKKQPCHLERLYGIITDLYIDKYKFKGQNVKSRVPDLLKCLYGYDLDNLLAFFDASL